MMVFEDENSGRSDILPSDSTPRASPGNGEADQAGSFSVDLASASFEKLKPPLSFDEQLAKMLGRGLSLGSMTHDEAIGWLASCNYYRMSGYWLTLEDGDRFVEGASFQDIVDIMLLDSDLRALISKMLGPVEIKLRTQMAYHLSRTYGPDVFYTDEAFKDRHAQTKSRHSMEVEIEHAKSRNAPCVVHNLKKYGRLPAWACVEVMSFGTLSRMYGNLENGDVASNIAQSFRLASVYLTSWLRCLTQVRNMCAHHERIYNRTLVYKPKIHRSDKLLDNSRGFAVLYILFKLYARSWPELGERRLDELEEILDAHRNVDLEPMGFPANWSERLRKMCRNGSIN